jgi:hypothetical protein
MRPCITGGPPELRIGDLSHPADGWPMILFHDATMVWWIRDVVWMAAIPVAPSESGTRSAGRQDRGRRRCMRCLIICKAPGSIERLGRWAEGKLVGFFDWDLAAPVTQEWDLAFTAFAWVLLHARRVVQGEGFTALADRPRRLRLFLDTYAWDGPLAEFVSTVQARVTASAEGIQRTAATGDPAYQRMLDTGVDESLRTAIRELEDFRSEVET